MIFQTQTQVNFVFIFIFFGFIIGMISTIYFMIFINNFSKKPAKILINCIFYSFFAIFFIFLINFYNYGKLSFVLFLSYILGYLIIKNTFKKTVVILERKWYNTIKLLSIHMKEKFKKRKKERNVNSKES